MKKTYLIVFAMLSVIFCIKSVKSQDIKYCGQAEAEERIKNENPGLYQQILQDSRELEEYTQSFSSERSGTRGTVYIIPVVFHIIHNYGVENISDDQVYDAIEVINKDFRKLNADTSDIVSAFKAIAGDSEIEFRLAQKDPNGNCTNGIIRVASQETYKGVNYWNDMSTSNVSRWPRSKYLNIWVVNSIQSGAAGYTYRPGAVDSSPNLDGIMVLHNYVGSIGTSSLQRSRTLTHEIGHWINLAHTWGQTNDPGVSTNCNDDDAVTDTPNTIGWVTCNLNGTTCNSLDNVQNYMDYSYCSKMFTQGQSTRMRAATTSTTAQRSDLWQPSNLTATGTDGTSILCEADFNANRTEICAGETVSFIDASYNNPATWNWTFTGATPSSSTDENPVVTYSTPGQYSVQLSASDGVASVNETKNNFITVLPSTGAAVPYIEGFETITSVPDNDLFVFNPDAGPAWQVASVGATGSKSIRIYNYNNSIGALDEISSTTIDLSSITSVNISFKVAFAQKSTGNSDELKFFASYNCGNNWMMRWNKSGSDLATVPAQPSAFTPSDTSHWVEHTITNIPVSYLVNNFRFKFQFISDGGNNIYIDDINIYDPTVGIKEQDKTAESFVVYPNPFSDEATVSFSLSRDETIKLSVIDLLGKESVVIPSRNLNSGEHAFKINRSEMNLSRGVYFIKYTQGDNVTVKKIVLK